MKKAIFFVTFILAAIFTNAQSQSNIEAEIKRLEQIVVTAILTGDSNLLKTVWAPEFMVNNPRNNVSPNRDAVLQVHKAGMINYSEFSRVIEQIQFQENLVITMGQETFVSRTDIPGAKTGQSYKRGFRNIWMLKQGKWQQIARHASIICE